MHAPIYVVQRVDHRQRVGDMWATTAADNVNVVDRAIDDRTGVLTIRLWHEHEQIRARIRATLDIESGEDTVGICESEEAIVDTVRRWLHDFDAPADPAVRGQ